MDEKAVGADPQPSIPPWVRALLIKLLQTIIAFLAGGAAIAGYLAAIAPAPEVDPVPSIVIAKEFKGKAHELISLKAETTGKMVRWRPVTPGLLVIDDLPDLIARKEIRVVACSPGRYEVECWSAILNEPTLIYRTVVVVGDAPVPPPNPAPPNPIPPVHPLTAKLQAAYDADVGNVTVKRAQRDLIVGLYTAMIEHAKQSAIVTAGDLLADLQVAGKAMLQPDALKECRRVISVEIASEVGIDPAAKLDEGGLRGKSIETFKRIAKSMSEVK